MSLSIQSIWSLLPSPHCRETSHRAEGLPWYLEQSRGKLQAAALLHKPPQSSPLQEALMAALLVPLSPEHSALGQFLVMRQPWVPTASIPCRASLPVPLTVLGQSTQAWISTTGGLQPKLWAGNPGPTTSPSLGYSMASWAMAGLGTPLLYLQGSPTPSWETKRKGESRRGIDEEG